MFDIGEEIIYEDENGNYMTQIARNEGTTNRYIYSFYDADDSYVGGVRGDADLGSLPLSQLKMTDVFWAFQQAFAPRTARSTVKAGSKQLSMFDTLRSSSKDSYKDNYYSYNYAKPQAKTGYVDKYNKSDTLVFHLNDPSTAMLRQLYEGKGYDVITDNNIDKDEIHQLMQSHDRIMCLGHGTAGGLIGGNIGPSEAPYFRGKKLFVIWCNADKFFERYCPEAKGQFITTNLPSERWECRAAGCGNISSELMLENITYWSKLCAEAAPMCLDGDVHEGVMHIRKNYLEKYGNHPVSIFNALGSQALGEREPLPEYEFKGEPLQPKDFPYPGFDEEEFLKNPTPTIPTSFKN